MMTATFGIMPVILAAWLGACFGSFSNVLIYRLPRNLSVVGPRSFCPACRKTVAWYDNIPIMSWLLLRGHCRNCDSAVPVRYVLVELGGAACVLVGILRFGWTIEGLSASLFLIILLDIAIIDWHHMVIPHTLTVGGMIIGMVLSLFGNPALPLALLGAVIGGGSILAVSYGYKLVRGMIGMGGGDVMLMGLVGVFLGPWGVPAVLFTGALFGTLYALSVGRGRLSGSAKLPFGTFLAAAAVVVLLFGDQIFTWYLSRF